MSRTSLVEVCHHILADNRGIATYLLVCIAPYTKRSRSTLPGHICEPEKDMQATWRVILQIPEGSNFRSRDYSPVIRSGARKICSAYEQLCLQLLSSYQYFMKYSESIPWTLFAQQYQGLLCIGYFLAVTVY